MPDGLYDRDILAWSGQQAALLRRLEAGERVNAAIDWINLIEEVESVGQSELRSCRSFLRLGMEHLLKLHAWPGSQAAQQWLSEAFRFLDDARDRFAPSMRQLIDLDDAFARALRHVQASTDQSGPPQPLPAQCPFSLDELLAGDVPALLQHLA